MDGGYTWDCIRGCIRGQGLPNLHAISTNVRLGGFGYDRAYYNAQVSTINGHQRTAHLCAFCMKRSTSPAESRRTKLLFCSYSLCFSRVQGGSNVDGIDWTLITLEAGQAMYKGLDGVYWDELATGVYMEGYVVGESGTIVRLQNAGVNGWDPEDVANPTPDPKVPATCYLGTARHLLAHWRRWRHFTRY